MANRNAEAFPVSDEGAMVGGLTKREYAAIHILASIATRDAGPATFDRRDSDKALAAQALRLANALMDAL